METLRALGLVCAVFLAVSCEPATAVLVEIAPPAPVEGAGPASDPGPAAGKTPQLPVSSPSGPATPEPPAAAPGWLYTQGNRIYQADGKVWRGRGANLHDTRGCNACTWFTPNVGEVKRRVDELVSWGANFIRLNLESYAASEGRMHWRSLLDDPSYLADVQEIVRHIGTKPGVYVMVSLWHDPSFTAMGWPSAQTAVVWKKLAETFSADAHVLYGLVNEPQSNYDGAHNATVWKAMNDTVAAIRSAETARGAPNHIIAVQGTGGWARHLSYYVDHPITAGGGKNIAYEVHVYDPRSEFQSMVTEPAKKLPIIIGEFGPAQGMTTQDCDALIDLATQLDVAYLAWTFHMRCPPNLIEDGSGGGCGVGMKLQPTAFGQLIKTRLGQPW